MENFYGLSVLNVVLFDPPGESEKRLYRRLDKLERVFRTAGVSRVILPEKFPTAYKFKLVRPVSVISFYRAMADAFTLKLLEKRGVAPSQGRVALTAANLCPELTNAAISLCRSVRAVRLDLPGEAGERLAQELQRQFGLPVVPPGNPVDACLSFGGRAGDLQFWEDGLQLSGLHLRVTDLDLPAEVEQQVMALLWERGRLKREDIQVTDIL